MTNTAPLVEAGRFVRETIGGRREELLGLLRTLVEIESHATQPDGVRRVGAVVAAQLEEAGFACESVAGRPIPPGDSWLTELMLPGGDYSEVAEAIVARKSGEETAVLLLGDLDTSYTPGALARFPYRIEDGRAFGPGVADMKGGLTVLVGAARALRDTGLAAPAMTVVLSPDEQAGSLRSRGVIEEVADGSDWCLCLECARDGGNLLATRAQVGVGRLDVAGREVHAGSAYGQGASAIRALAEKVIAVEALTDREREIYLSVGEIHGGRRRSVVPGSAHCTIDIRTRNARDWAEVEEGLAAIAERLDVPGTTATLRVYSHRPAVDRPAGPLLEVARRAGSALSISFEAQHSPAAGSSAFAAGVGIPTLDGMGPPGGDLMTQHEYVEVDGIFERAALLALTLHLLSVSSPVGGERDLVHPGERSIA